MAKDKLVKIRLTLDVTYKPNGETVKELKYKMNDIAVQGVNHGLMTGEGPAEVEEWKSKVQIIP